MKILVNECLFLLRMKHAIEIPLKWKNFFGEIICTIFLSQIRSCCSFCQICEEQIKIMTTTQIFWSLKGATGPIQNGRHTIMVHIGQFFSKSCKIKSFKFSNDTNSSL